MFSARSGRDFKDLKSATGTGVGKLLIHVSNSTRS